MDQGIRNVKVRNNNMLKDYQELPIFADETYNSFVDGQNTSYRMLRANWFGADT